MEVEGTREIFGKLELFIPGMRDALSAALYQEGLAVDAESVKQVPVDTGRLRGTHYVAPPTEGAASPVCEIGYGTDYAVPVHENMKARHGPAYTDPKGHARGAGQKAKYLSDPLNDARRGYNRRLGARAWGNWKRGIGVRAIPRTAPTRPKK